MGGVISPCRRRGGLIFLFFWPWAETEYEESPSCGGAKPNARWKTKAKDTRGTRNMVWCLVSTDGPTPENSVHDNTSLCVLKEGRKDMCYISISSRALINNYLHTDRYFHASIFFFFFFRSLDFSIACFFFFFFFFFSGSRFLNFSIFRLFDISIFRFFDFFIFRFPMWSRAGSANRWRSG